MNIKELQEMIKGHEGYRNTVYKDSLGYLTGGYGHAFLEGSRIPEGVSEMLFQSDFTEAYAGAEKVIEDNGLILNAMRKAILVDMAFNMGERRLRGFKKMIQAMKDQDYGTAAHEMLDSRWAEQVGKRAYSLAGMMETGVFYTEDEEDE